MPTKSFLKSRSNVCVFACYIFGCVCYTIWLKYLRFFTASSAVVTVPSSALGIAAMLMLLVLRFLPFYTFSLPFLFKSPHLKCIHIMIKQQWMKNTIVPQDFVKRFTSTLTLSLSPRVCFALRAVSLSVSLAVVHGDCVCRCVYAIICVCVCVLYVYACH